MKPRRAEDHILGQTGEVRLAQHQMAPGIFQRRGFLFTEAVACTFIANRNGISGVQQQPQQRPVAHAKSDDGNGFPPKRTYIRIQCHGCLPIIFVNLCIIFGFRQKFNTYRVDKRIGSG